MLILFYDLFAIWKSSRVFTQCRHVHVKKQYPTQREHSEREQEQEIQWQKRFMRAPLTKEKIN